MKKRYFSLFVKSCQKNVTQTPPKRTLSPGKVEKIRFLKIEKIENVFTKKFFCRKVTKPQKIIGKTAIIRFLTKNFLHFWKLKKLNFCAILKHSLDWEKRKKSHFFQISSRMIFCAKNDKNYEKWDFFAF